MTYFLVIGCVVCGWAMLRIIGAERTIRLDELEARMKAEAPKPPPPPKPTPPLEAKSATPPPNPLLKAVAAPKPKH